MKYRKKPVEVEAIQWTGNNFEEVKAFTNGKAYKSLINDNTLVIDTLEGKHLAILKDFIIKGIQNEFYPCKPDIFKETYEKAEKTPLTYFLNNEELVVAMNNGGYLLLTNRAIEIIANKEKLPQWVQELTTGNVNEMRNIK